MHLTFRTIERWFFFICEMVLTFLFSYAILIYVVTALQQ